MKNLSVLLLMVLTVIGNANGTNAALVDQGNGVILDDVIGLYWYQNLDEFENMTYLEQITHLSEIPHVNGTWRMAQGYDMEMLLTYTDQEITSVFYPTLIGGSQGDYWQGRYNVESLSFGYHYYIRIIEDEYGNFSRLEGFIPDDASASILGAWAVTDTNPVPLPGAAILFGSSIFGIIGIRRKLKK